MKKLAAILIPSLALLAPAGLLAQDTVEKPARVVKSVLKSGAIVEAVDRETREIKLVGPDGRRFTVVAGPEVRNFAQSDPRDRIVVQYTESIAIVVTAMYGGGSSRTPGVLRAASSSIAFASVGGLT